MNNGYQQEDREYLLIDYVYKVLSHWRSIIVAMVVCAVAFGGIKYFKDTKNLKAQMQAQENFNPEEQMDEMLGQLSDKERKEVERVLRFEKIKAERENYIDTAAVMQLDQSNVDENILHYYVKTEGEVENIAELLNAYKLNFLTDEVTKEISEISDGVAIKDVTTMITASCVAQNEMSFRGENTTILKDASAFESLYITVRGFSKDNVMSMSDVVKKAVSDYSKKAQEIYGKHKIVLVNDFYQNGADDYVGIIQNEVYNQSFDLQNIINVLVGDFSGVQNSIYDFYLNNVNKESENVINDNINLKTSVSKIWVIIGAFFGVFIIAGWQLVIWVLGDRVNSPEEIIGNYDIYNFGIFEDKEALKKGKLFAWVDYIIYRLCYRERLELTCEEQFDIILSGIVEKCMSENIEKVYLVNTGNINSQTKSFCEKLAECAKTNGISLTIGDYPCSNASGLSQMIQHGYTLFCDNIANMKRNEFIRLLQMCREYDVQMIGTVFIV